jgi:Sec-independent protein translocase protein TatA
LDLSFSEIVLVCVIAFLVFGPEEFVKKAAQFGRFVGKFKTHAGNFKIMAEEQLMKKQTLQDLEKSLEMKKDDEKPGQS